MAFVNRIGNFLKQRMSKHMNLELSASNSSLYQTIRSMSSSKLFVGGLSYNTDEMSLREAFSQHGEVVEARVIMDRESGRSRGFGFVSYTSSDEASRAIQAFDGQDLHGRRIRVNYATDRPRAPRFDGGYGGGSGFNYGGGNGGYGSPGGYGSGNYGDGGGRSGYGSGNYGNSNDNAGGDGFGGSNYGSGVGDGKIGNFGAGGGNNYSSGGGGGGFNYGGGNGGYGSPGGYGSGNYGDGGGRSGYGSGNYGNSNDYAGRDGFGGSNYGSGVGDGKIGNFGAGGGGGGGNNDSSDLTNQGGFANSGYDGNTSLYGQAQEQLSGNQGETDAPDEDFGQDTVDGNYKDDNDDANDYVNIRG